MTALLADCELSGVTVRRSKRAFWQMRWHKAVAQLSPLYEKERPVAAAGNG
jgi:hypothetical protein